MADSVSVTDLAVVTEQSAVQVRQFAAGEGVAERLPPAPRAKPSATADRRQAKVLTPAPEVKPKPLPARPPSADVIDVPSPQLVRANLRQWRQASDAELAMQLRSASPYDALAIATVMRERGLAGGNVAEWKGNFRASTDGGVFEGLSQLPPAQVRERLRQLATHADPDVRLTALTLMATSGDPQLDEIVRRRAVEDADPRVAELAGRIMRGEMK
jgi:hypothetical protein